MNTIENIINIDKKIQILYRPVFESTPNFIESSKTPSTTRLLFNLTKRVDSIKEGIFATASVQNYYSTEILLRTLIEHYLTYMYANSKLKNENDDSVGKDYYVERSAGESIDYWEANSKIAKILNEEDAATEIKRVIYEERFPELKKITKKQLTIKNNQFKVKEMIKYFLKDIDFKVLGDNEDLPVLSNLRHFTDWVQLSSFIHCGPLAEEMALKYSDTDKKNNRLINIAEYTFKISNGIKCLCVIHLFSITQDIKYLQLAAQIENISKEIKLPPK